METRRYSWGVGGGMRVEGAMSGMLGALLLLAVVAGGCQGTRSGGGPKGAVGSPGLAAPGWGKEAQMEGMGGGERPEAPDLSFLPEVWVSPPRQGPTDIPFSEEPMDIRERLRLLNFRPVIFPYHSSRGGLAFTKDVGVPKLELQELGDGRTRVWVRVQNIIAEDIVVQVSFEPTDERARPTDRLVLKDIILIEEVFRDFSFIMDGPTDRRFAVTINTRPYRAP